MLTLMGTLLITFLLLGEFILVVLGGTGELLKESLAYCLVFLSGGFLIWISGSLGAVIRGSGDMRFPALMMVFSSGLQVFFSAGFILGWYGFPKLGIMGAALSALISAGFLTLMMILKLKSKSSLVKLNFSRLSFKKDLFEDIFNAGNEAEIDHISLSRWADLILVLPTTANMMAKLSFGRAEDLATTVILASN